MLDLTNSKYPTRSTCSSEYVTNPPPDLSSSSDTVASRCTAETGLTAGVIVALVIWVLILICCVGGCCFSVWYIAYQRGKRHQMVHVDEFASSNHSDVGGNTNFYRPNAYSIPIQMGVIVNDHSALQMQQQQLYYPQQGPVSVAGTGGGGGGGAGDYEKPQQSHIPLVVATPI